MNRSKELGGATVEPAAVSGATPEAGQAGKYKALPPDGGWVRVPREATYDMQVAGWSEPYPSGADSMAVIWRAMIAAAPVSVAPTPDAWFPIESAPKDGTAFVGLRGNRAYTTERGQNYDKWPSDPGGPTYVDVWNYHVPGAICPWSPTHWQPLPQPPVAGRENDERIAEASKTNDPNPLKSGAS